MMLSKLELEGRVEPHIIDRLTQNQYIVVQCDPKELVTWNRLDLGFRTAYLFLKDKLPNLANKIYYEDLRAQSLGSLVDPDNDKKSNFGIFQAVFEEVSQKIATEGFDQNTTLLPVSNEGSILNGGHRLSSALFHKKKVSFIQTELPKIVCDYQYFFDRAVPEATIEQAVCQLLSYIENAFIAFLWPSGKSKLKKTESLFDHIIYKKRLELTTKGALNLLFQCYHHMDWIGTEANNYKGLHQKLIECFPDSGEAVMIIFQSSDGIDHVRSIKEKIREINGIGFSSVHITDTTEEVRRLANLLCNKNGLHYLNNANLIRQSHLKKINEIIEQADEKNISMGDFLVDGSWLLELYGLRKANDLDILTALNKEDIYSGLKYEPRLKEITWHQKNQNQLVYDPDNHFYLFGLKFVGFEQLALMKKNRGERKDLIDLELMAVLNESHHWRKIRSRVLQKILYAKIRLRRNLFSFVQMFLRSLGLYYPARSIYRMFYRRKS